MPQPSKSQYSSRSSNSKGRAAPRIKTGARSARVRSSEEPISPNPHPAKIAWQSGSGMSRLKDILSGSHLSARASQEAAAGRGCGARGFSTRVLSQSRLTKPQDMPLSIDLDTIVFLPYGVVESPELDESESENSGGLKPTYMLLPSQVLDFSAGGISTLMQRGLAVINHSTGFTLRASNSYSDVASILRAALPRLLEYLDQVEFEADDNGDSDPESMFLLTWMVCTKRSWNATTLDVFSGDNKYPDGTEIVNAMIASAGKAKVAAKDCILFLTTRRRIPKHVLDSWKPKVRRLGSVGTLNNTTCKSASNFSGSEAEAESSGTTDNSENENTEDESEDQHREGEDVNNNEKEVGEIILILDLSDDELPTPAVRATHATTVPAEERNDEAFLASFDFLNDPKNPHIKHT